ncbi:hypothetical protein [Bradyrhizobium guangzhouense]|uniref:hypothetical protein n=1 Tax=Bradyrhizobium guangzhouense TaxID=1325095 RepID=UPI0010099731|nr:hypothetical protein [Bradyrhizobium guangzhouense]RXH16923.1 hypothetical protein EAS54_16250 [Bradyrhizobium guangzhouense]
MSLEEKSLRNEMTSYLRGEQPIAERLAASPRLEGWAVKIGRGRSEYEMALLGRVTGHPRTPDGSHVATTPVIWLDRKRRWARTLNTLYALGEPEEVEIPIDGMDA